MTAIPILSGIYAKENAEFAVEYPTNLEPVVLDTGLSKGFLKTPAGVVPFGTGPGIDRGGITWNGICYRVMGSRLVKVSSQGHVVDLGNVGTDGLPVSLDYSFDRLSIGSAGLLFYYRPVEGVQIVSDVDLGPVVDHVFIDGYFMTTDGESLVVTELNDPFAVDPLKYGSSESDPDPVLGLIVVRGEVYALNRYTIDVFNDVGGNGFPFALNGGAEIPKGCVGTYAKTLFADSFVFVGSGRNEALGVYQAGSGQAVKLSTRAIDEMLAAVDTPSDIICEAVTADDEQRLYIHLPDRTLVFLAGVSAQSPQPTWYIRRSRAGEKWRPRSFTYAYNSWLCGDAQSAAIGRVDPSATGDFGDLDEWSFSTSLVYSGAKGAIVHSLELLGLPGRARFEKDATVLFSHTLDGERWSEERAVPMGTSGQRSIRVQCRPHWRMRNYISFRFRGASNAPAGWARLEANLEPLSV